MNQETIILKFKTRILHIMNKIKKLINKKEIYKQLALIND